MMKSDIVDIELHRHHETEKAVLVSDDGDEKSAVWLAKELIEIETLGNNISVAMPEWLAMEKGLI